MAKVFGHLILLMKTVLRVVYNCATSYYFLSSAISALPYPFWKDKMTNCGYTPNSKWIQKYLGYHLTAET